MEQNNVGLRNKSDNFWLHALPLDIAGNSLTNQFPIIAAKQREQEHGHGTPVPVDYDDRSNNSGPSLHQFLQWSADILMTSLLLSPSFDKNMASQRFRGQLYKRETSARDTFSLPH